MGGGSTSRTVTTYDSSYDKSSSLRSASYGSYSKQAQKEVGRTTGSKKTLPTKEVVSESPNPVVVAIDVTGSMGDAAFVCWDKMPLLFGQLNMHYASEPEVSYCAIGDAVAGDKWPLQVCDFAEGDGLDDQLKLIYREGGGGMGITESYETAAFYYLNKCSLVDSEKAFLFIIGDEAPYADIQANVIKTLFKDKSVQGINTKTVFDQLQEKFEVVFIQIPYRGEPSATEEVTYRWKQYLPESRVLKLRDAKGVIDVILGAVAMLNGKRTLDQYLVDLKGENGIREEGQTPKRIREVEATLKPLSKEFNKDGSRKVPSKTKKQGRIGKVVAAAES